jgi:hypothetical protein
MDQARLEFGDLVSHASDANLRRPTSGSRWTNRQLLFHMLFGYLIVCRLLFLVLALGRLRDGEHM